MNDRREFLKLFGAGAAIVPIIGGLPMREAEARIITPGTVELANKTPPVKIHAGFKQLFGRCLYDASSLEMQTTFIDKEKNVMYISSMDTYITELHLEPTYPSRIVELPGHAPVRFWDDVCAQEWTMKGRSLIKS